MLSTETWLNIEGYEGVYQCSNLGRVKSVMRDAVLSPAKNSSGYYRVLLCKDGKKTNKFVHRLVADAFVPNPESKPQVNHIDGNKENNTAVNLEWVTQAENMDHIKRLETDKMGQVLRIVDNCIKEAHQQELDRIEQSKARIKAIEEQARELGVEL